MFVAETSVQFVVKRYETTIVPVGRSERVNSLPKFRTERTSTVRFACVIWTLGAPDRRPV
jgi:hypothetical protein